MNTIVREDMEYIYSRLTEQELEKLRGSKVLITGCAGFFGFHFVNFFSYFREKLDIKRVICLDNFMFGKPEWLKEIEAEGKLEFREFNVITDDVSAIPGATDCDIIIHMASIASPLFYRKHPIETLDANIWGLRRLLDIYRDKPIKGLIFFSSSEVYGDPTPENIPTKETYRGNVDCLGPRACYDEAKRFGETMCYLFNQKYGTPISVIRPFNNYGPGMGLEDARVPADFAKAVIENKDIVIYSDGTPTRTFCYIADAIAGYFKGILHADEGFAVYNIGKDKPEITIRNLAEIYADAGRDVVGYTGTYSFKIHEDVDYLKNNPNRRCPNIDKARAALGYNPQITTEDGVRRLLRYLKEEQEK